MTTRTARATGVRAPRTTAKAAQSCALCPQRIKPGTRIGLHFASNTWVHLGCLVRTVNAANREIDQANDEHFGVA